jgi:hypothetical protein
MEMTSHFSTLLLSRIAALYLSNSSVYMANTVQVLTDQLRDNRNQTQKGSNAVKNMSNFQALGNKGKKAFGSTNVSSSSRNLGGGVELVRAR